MTYAAYRMAGCSVLLCMCGAVACCATSSLPQPPTSNESGLVLYLHPERTTYNLGEPILVDLEVHNSVSQVEISADSFVRLPPMHHLGQRIDMKRFYSINGAGRYLVTARYENRASGEKWGGAAWVGALNSNTIEINVE